ncbi:MAG: phosphoribosylaminoimidazolesuccinocarboxamide synthase [Flavobacteriales bacterium]
MSDIPEKRDFLYEGKAKQVYSTERPDEVIIHYKDDATAYNAQKRGVVSDKGVFNNAISTHLFELLAQHGIATHFIEKISDREQRCKRVSIIPLEVIPRNWIAGSMAKRLGIQEGTRPPNAICDLCYKDDALGDPLINDDHAVALGVTTYAELKEIYNTTAQINALLQAEFDRVGIVLVDCKLEFGKDAGGDLLLADEISPDTCRLWDKATLKKLDKDRFRRDLGAVREAYAEILQRLECMG